MNPKKHPNYLQLLVFYAFFEKKNARVWVVWFFVQESVWVCVGMGLQKGHCGCIFKYKCTL